MARLLGKRTIVIRHDRSASLEKILVFFVMLYCFSINSYQALIPSPIKIVFILGFPLMLSVTVCFIHIVMQKLTITKSIAVASAICMIAIMLFWNNHTIKDEGVLGMYGQIMPMLFFLAVCSRGDWHDELIDIMIIMGAFYSAWTIICLIWPDVYYSIIAPLMQELYPQINYSVDAKAGFTAHYSTNGMYLANGIIACITKCVKQKDRDNKSINWLFVLLIFEVAAFLICGKRGTLLCLIMACYIAYFVYEANKPKGRLFKIIIFTFVLVVIVFLASLIVPSLANAYLRMAAMISSGDDVTTGRLALWLAGWNDFKTSPIIGHGWRWFLYYDRSVFIHHDVHNCFLQFLVELGLLGSIPFFVFFIVNMKHTVILLRIIRRFPKKEQVLNNVYPLLFCIIYESFFTFYCFEGTAFYNPETLIPFLAACAITEFNFRRLKRLEV